ncbi:MAG: DUF4336 domain-containing protein [Rhodosalinus sp.]
MPRGYPPLFTPKPFGCDLWLVDGPAIRFYGMPFSTRMTVVRLSDGGLWLHSPVERTPGLAERLAVLGPVRHLIAPNWIHYAWLGDWAEACPQAETWAAPGVAGRAASRGMTLRVDHGLGGPAPWSAEIDHLIVEGSAVHREAVFFHRASRTLILTDLIENFEPARLPWFMRPLVRLAGIAHPKGRMPPDMAATFDKAKLRAGVERMIAWRPERLVLAHGHCFQTGAVRELERAFARVL